MCFRAPSCIFSALDHLLTLCLVPAGLTLDHKGHGYCKVPVQGVVSTKRKCVNAKEVSVSQASSSGKESRPTVAVVESDKEKSTRNKVQM